MKKTPSIINSLDLKSKGKNKLHVYKLYPKVENYRPFRLVCFFVSNSHHVIFSGEFAFLSSYIFCINKTHTS